MRKGDLSARDFLGHMLDSIARIERYTREIGEEEFLNDTMLQDAVVRNIEIIGEAANNLMEADSTIGARYPSIPFAQIYGMRNRITHGYFAVSISMIWDSVQVDIPELKAKISQVLAEYPSK